MPFRNWLIKQQIRQMFPGINEIYLDEILEFYNLESNSIGSITNRISEKLLELDGYPKDQNGLKGGELPSLSSLNNNLLLVMEMFPEIGAIVIRDLLARFSGNCVPYIIDKIMRLKKDHLERRLLGQMVRERDLFRDEEYRSQVKRLLLNEFPYHWNSTISAVMAESNDYYPDCHAKLSEIKASNLWTTFLPFTKRSWIDFKIDHEELARELEEMERLKVLDFLENDESIATKMNYDEYLNSNQLITCQCCFGETVFEELGQCDNGHLFCRSCISQSIKIGLFDTGNLRNGKNLQCMTSESECKAGFSLDEVKRNCSKDLFIQYQGFIWQAAIKKVKNIDYITCPFCKYTEEKPKNSFLANNLPIIFDMIQKHGTLTLRFCSMIFIFFITLHSSLLATLMLLVNNHIYKHKGAILMYLKRKIQIPGWIKRKPILIMNCKNPDCLKVTCGECEELWVAPHKCFEKQVDSLRLYVENAKSNALIRVCPSCSIRFSKIDGCNKMTCPNCKYEMCYVCRQDIGNQKYDHFCQHFRIVPGSDCSECKKCDLYQKERDDVAVAKAARKAEKEWIQLHPNDAQKIL